MNIVLLAFVMALGFDKVHIGQHDYRVVLTETGFTDSYENKVHVRSVDVIGQFDETKRVILLRPSLPLAKLQITLMHEIQIHGCFYETKLNENAQEFTEDDVANNLDECMTNVIKQNPKLVNFIQRSE
jgi:hypothetical protein